MSKFFCLFHIILSSKIFPVKDTIWLILLLQVGIVSGQVLPQGRSTDWMKAGLSTPSLYPVVKINILDFNADPSGISPSDQAFQAAKASQSGLTLIYFPPGIYLFGSTMVMRDSLIIQGAGSEMTTLRFDLGGSGDLISVTGSLTPTIDSLVTGGMIGDSFCLVASPNLWQPGDVARLSKYDQDLVNDSWAYNTVAQIVQVQAVSNDTVFLDQLLRTDFPLSRDPVLRKITPRNRVGIECLKIERTDPTTSQSKNIRFHYAIDCWVKGVESDMCNFSHVVADWSSHLQITESYFHHAFNYGSGGKAYGVVLQSASNLCLVENNIFEHLRHSMLLQSGANGNVFALNYSTDPFWTGFPTNSAGDIVCHGNYPFSNLFDHNIVQNIIVDNSHAANGPYNTFFRNRAELYGIFVTSTLSPSQNFIGNEIPQGSYSLSGQDHFEYGNNVKGTITPAGTENLPDASYHYADKPEIITGLWPRIGPPASINANSIPARDRFLSMGIYTVCKQNCQDQFAGWSVWSGCNGDDDWFNLGNWHSGMIPGSNDDVYIPGNPAGGPYYPVIDLDAAINSLCIEEGGKIEIISGVTFIVFNP